MKKTLAALVLTAVLACNGLASAATEEYTIHPGAQLQIYVMGHRDLSSPVDNSDSSYVVRPDGTIDFPLIGTVNTSGKTVSEFKQELSEKLREYIIDPIISVNVTKWGSTRVYVLGEIRRQGAYSLSRGTRVLDALSAAGGFTSRSAKKRIFLIRNGQEKNILELNFNNYLRKGDVSQNVMLNEGDCLYLTSNGKITLQGIFSNVVRGLQGWYYYERSKDDE